MRKNEDILWNLDAIFELESQDELAAQNIEVSESATEETLSVFYEHIEEISHDDEKQEVDIFISSTLEEENAPQKKNRFVELCIFIIKYATTSISIFGVLLVASNYSAYWNLAYSFIYAEEMQHTQKSLIESVAAANITEDNSEESEEEKKKEDTFEQLKDEDTPEYAPSIHSLSYLTQNNTENVKLGIEITPYENRVVIPKIGKNIPLIDITQQKVSGIDELNDIFMDELENGVIRYPGSAKPGENGNAFIFGHSSNFPWMEWEYNDVFALLDHVVYDDEVVVYYGQEKHTYKIKTKNVIKPGDVSVLKNNENDKSKITLMTCWPIGTTLNRLVLTWELISVE